MLAHNVFRIDYFSKSVDTFLIASITSVRKVGSHIVL